MATKIKESSMNAHNLQVLAAHCDVNAILRCISQRWKMPVLYCISTGLQHFSGLKKVFPTLSDQVLGKRLGEMVQEGLIHKTILAGTSIPQTQYTITEKGNALMAIILQLRAWGHEDWPAVSNN